MQTTTKQLWASVFAAMARSLCCFAPLVLIALGISGAWIGHLTALEPHRPVSIGVMLVFLGLAFRQLYIVPLVVRRARPVRIRACSAGSSKSFGPS